MLCSATVEDNSSIFHDHLPPSLPWPDDFEQLHPLNFDRVQFAHKQRQYPWLGPLAHFLLSGNSAISICHYSPKVRKSVANIAKQAQLTDGLLFYSDEFLKTPDHLHLFVPLRSLTTLYLHSYHDSPLGMHRGRDATYNAQFHVVFTCAIYPSMSGTGFAVVRTAFVLKP